MTHATMLASDCNFSRGFGNAQARYDRFQEIVEQIKTCDAVLKSRTLDPIRVSVAHRLIAGIERGLEQLGRATAQSAYVGAPSLPGWFSQIDGLLDHLSELCEELVTTLDRPSFAQPSPVV